MNTNTKLELLKQAKKEYRTLVSKKAQTELITRYIRILGYDRKHMIKLLSGKHVPGMRHGRGKTYNKEFQIALINIWERTGCICAENLKDFMEEHINLLKHHNHFVYSQSIENQLKNVSVSTMKRIFCTYTRFKVKKAQFGTKPGTLLKKQIQVRVRNWDIECPGYIEIDLVEHNGGNQGGEFHRTLNMVDIKHGWNISVAIRNKSENEVVGSIQRMLPLFPFPILGIDSDNGSEFINHQLLKFCIGNNIQFTRTRPYEKNDNAHIESKNWSVVRRFVGYFRYDTDHSIELLNMLYENLNTYINFFRPTRKSTVSMKTDGKRKKAFDKARSPYRRVLEDIQILQATKDKLTQIYNTTDPDNLLKQIREIQKELRNSATRLS